MLRQSDDEVERGPNEEVFEQIRAAGKEAMYVKRKRVVEVK